MPVKDAMTNSASGVYVAVINLENKMKQNIPNFMHLTCMVYTFPEISISKSF